MIGVLRQFAEGVGYVTIGTYLWIILFGGRVRVQYYNPLRFFKKGYSPDKEE